MIKHIFIVPLILILILFTSCDNRSSTLVDENISVDGIDANLTGSEPPMFPGWDGPLPKY